MSENVTVLSNMEFHLQLAHHRDVRFLKCNILQNIYINLNWELLSTPQVLYDTSFYIYAQLEQYEKEKQIWKRFAIHH